MYASSYYCLVVNNFLRLSMKKELLRLQICISDLFFLTFFLEKVFKFSSI